MLFFSRSGTSSLFCLITFLSLVQAAARHSKRQLSQPAAQPIDIYNAHAFVAPPGASDLRGPCPAMNALANHGYIARNGYTNLLEAVNAVAGLPDWLVSIFGSCLRQTICYRTVCPGLFVQVLILLWAWPPLGPYKLVMVITSPLAAHHRRAFLLLAFF